MSYSRSDLQKHKSFFHYNFYLVVAVALIFWAYGKIMKKLIQDKKADMCCALWDFDSSKNLAATSTKMH